MAFRLVGSVAGTAAAIAALGLMGCSDLGSVGPSPNNNNDQVIGQQCEAILSVTGTFTPIGTGLGVDGECDPEGTWTLQVTLADPGDCAEDTINIEAEYVYSVIYDDTEGYITVWNGDPAEERSYLKMTVEGPCQGSFEHYSEDGLELVLLKPYTMDPVTTLSGTGVFELYDEDQLANL